MIEKVIFIGKDGSTVTQQIPETEAERELLSTATKPGESMSDTEAEREGLDIDEMLGYK